MSKEIKIKGNSVLIRDTVSDIVELSIPTKYAYYNLSELTDGILTLIVDGGSVSGSREVYTTKLANAVDENGIAFSVDTFKMFAQLYFKEFYLSAMPRKIEDLDTTKYFGFSVEGTLDSDSGWIINKIYDDGVTTTVGKAYGAWNDRVSLTYK